MTADHAGILPQCQPTCHCGHGKGVLPNTAVIGKCMAISRYMDGCLQTGCWKQAGAGALAEA
jgi:hypothetical protein